MTGAVSRDFCTRGSFLEIVAGAAEPRSADFVASAALCEP